MAGGALHAVGAIHASVERPADKEPLVEQATTRAAQEQRLLVADGGELQITAEDRTRLGGRDDSIPLFGGQLPGADGIPAGDWLLLAGGDGGQCQGNQAGSEEDGDATCMGDGVLLVRTLNTIRLRR
jgi:hypothetical protein